MSERSKDGMAQAQRDLKSTGAQLEDGFSEWTCFISQQAAEKAVKAIFQRLGVEVWEHSVTDLSKALQEKISIPEKLIDKAKNWTGSIPLPDTRMAGFEGIPSEYITREDAQDAISNSERIIQFCKNFLAE